jgi:hypothetical protein
MGTVQHAIALQAQRCGRNSAVMVEHDAVMRVRRVG